MLKNTTTAWGSISKSFHWIIALAVIAMIAIGFTHDYFNPAIKGQLMWIHKSLGLTVLGLMTLRLIWRSSNPVPLLPENTPHWQKISAKISHTSLYVILFLMPISGWIMSTAANRNVPFWWVNNVTMPLIPISKPLSSFAHSTHVYFAYILSGILILHILGAFSHHFINKDAVLKRML